MRSRKPWAQPQLRNRAKMEEAVTEREFRERMWTDWARSPSWRRKPTSPAIATASKSASESSLSAARYSSGSVSACALRMWCLQSGILQGSAITKPWRFPIFSPAATLRFPVVLQWEWKRQRERLSFFFFLHFLKNWIWIIIYKVEWLWVRDVKRVMVSVMRRSHIFIFYLLFCCKAVKNTVKILYFYF